jgi:O-antigen/teichoic acid export membrane protein
LSKLLEVSRSSFRGSLLLFIGTLSSTIILAITAIVTARLLGPEDYGLYSIILTIPSILVTVSDLGISPALTRYSASLGSSQEEPKIVNLIEIGLLSKIIFTIIIGSVMFLLANPISKYILNRPEEATLLKITFLYLIGQSLLNSLNSIFIGLDQAGKCSLLQNIQAIIKAVAIPGLILIGYGLTGALIGIGLGFIISTIIGILLISLSLRQLKKKLQNLKQPQSFSGNLRTLLGFGAPLYLSELLFSFQTQIKNILLALYCSNVSIGNYSTAMNFTVFIMVMASPITTIMFPAFSKMNLKNDHESLETLYKLSVKYTSLIIVPAATGLAILSKEIVNLLYGARYQTAPRYLSLYSLLFFLTALGYHITGSLLNSQGDTGVTLRINLLNLIVSLTLALSLIPRLGVTGLIASTITSQLISNIYALNRIKKKYKITIDYKSSIRIILSTLISGSTIYLFLNSGIQQSPLLNIIISITIFIPTYMILTPITGAINNEDLENMNILTQDITILQPITKIFLKIEKKIIKFRL